MHRGNHRRHRGMHHNRATVAGVLNSTAESDEQARQRILRVFGPLLVAVFVCDVTCAVIMMYLSCSNTSRQDNTSTTTSSSSSSSTAAPQQQQHGHCLTSQLWHGLQFRAMSQNVGDLFWLAVLRCFVTVGLLWLGVQYGGRRRQQQQCRQQQDSLPFSSSFAQDSVNAVENTTTLTEPLLLRPSTNQTNSSSMITTTTTTTSTASNVPTNNRDEDDMNNAASALEAQVAPPMPRIRHQPNRNRFFFWNNRRQVEPFLARNATLAALFVASTAYQIYAGLKVSMYPGSSSYSNNHNSNSSSINDNFAVAITILMCLTVLWVNAAAALFRILLTELTREQGLFLPPTVHRHPVYWEDSRGLAMHWCDMCRQRMKPGEGGCFRCALCDFDVCKKCSQRSDAATVGENVLRGDRGVRVETSLDNASYLRRSMEIARSELPLLGVSFVLLGASSVSRLLLPHFQGTIIDKVIPNAAGDYDKDGFSYYIKLYVFLMLGQGALSTLYSAIFTLVSRRLKFTIRNSLFERILSQDVAYFDGTESGRLISRLTNDLDLMMAPIQSSLSSLLSNVLLLIGGMVMCFIKSYRLSMLAFVTVGPITYLWDHYAQWSKGLAREMLAYWAEGNSIASQALSHIRTVKAFGCEEKVISKYSEANKQALHCGVKDAWGNGLTSALTGYLDLGSGVLILWFGGHLVYRGEMSVGELVTFQLFWNMMNNAYQNLQGLVTSFTRSAAGAEKIFSLWDSEPDIDPLNGADVNWDVRGALEFQNVKFFYQMRPDNIVLENFNLAIPAGKTLALVGRSGGGKSTLISLLLRFYDVKKGKVLIDGREYESLKVQQLRRLFGVVTQETELFALTVEENIAYGLDKDEYTMDAVIDAAKKAFAHDFICEMKDGYQTRIGERGNRLSGGQRQRLAIARVFLRRPKIILLDEATSALDENSQEEVQKALSTLIAESNATVVLVAHRLSTVKTADNIVVIDKGVALEQGNHDELLSQGGIYASMVQKHDKKKADQLDQQQEKHGRKDDSRHTKSVDDIDSLLDDQLKGQSKEQPEP